MLLNSLQAASQCKAKIYFFIGLLGSAVELTASSNTMLRPRLLLQVGLLGNAVALTASSNIMLKQQASLKLVDQTDCSLQRAVVAFYALDEAGEYLPSLSKVL